VAGRVLAKFEEREQELVGSDDKKIDEKKCKKTIVSFGGERQHFLS
jgi:hypothetical protein